MLEWLMMGDLYEARTLIYNHIIISTWVSDLPHLLKLIDWLTILIYKHSMTDAKKHRKKETILFIEICRNLRQYQCQKV